MSKRTWVPLLLAITALLMMLGCGGPKLTEQEALQLVNAYLELKTYSTANSFGRLHSCSVLLRRQPDFQATWKPEQKVWLVTAPRTPQLKYEWLVHERTLVVEPNEGFKGQEC